MWDSNLHRGWHPPRWVEQAGRNDQVIARVDLDTHLWHAGGLDAIGDLIAIPLTDGRDSRIVYYDVAKPTRPSRLEQIIERPSVKALAVAIARVVDGRFLVAILTDSSIDFGISDSSGFLDGFGSTRFVRWEADGPNRGLESITEAQNLNFLAQCDGTLYLLALWDTTSVAPLIPGKNVALLFEITFSRGRLFTGPDP